MLALADCNNFYVSCERLFNPALNNRPVAVLSNNDGCIIARSNEVKELGIPMGAPAFEYKDIIERHNVVLLSSNYVLYNDISCRVMAVLMQACPDVEIYSIDESFMDFSTMEKIRDVFEFCVRLRKDIFRRVGIPVSIGIGPTKALAKAANRYAKKNAKAVSVYKVELREEIRALLEWLPVEDVWGIGSRYARRLHAMGIRTALGFTDLPDEWVRKHLTIRGLALKKELLGEKIWPLEHQPPRKSVATTRSFEHMISTFDELRERITAFCANIGRKLRQYGKKARELVVFLRTNPFRNDLPQYHNALRIPLPYATDSDLQLTRYAVVGLKKIFREGYLYKKAGVVALGLQDASFFCPTLFDDPKVPEKHTALMKALDRIQSRFGRGSLHPASQVGLLTHRMRREKISPCYTTRWNDVLKVRCF